jgi:biotin transport system permease protein
MLTLTYPREIWAHHLPAGVKLAGLCLATIALFALKTPMALAFAALAIAGLIASGGGQFAQTSARLLRPLWPFVAIVALWHLWLRDPAGVAIILRMISAVAFANFVTMTTRLSDMMRVIERLLRPLSRLGLSARQLALAVALVIRFVPVMLARAGQIRASWRARSPRRPGWRILVPIILSALDDADHVAQALRARGGAG